MECKELVITVQKSQGISKHHIKTARVGTAITLERLVHSYNNVSVYINVYIY